MTSPIQSSAYLYRQSGLNILPAWKKSKRPSVARWACYQNKMCETPITESIDALCVVCGAISGNVEVIDFDFQAESFNAWRDAVLEVNPIYAEVLNTLYVETTQSGGKHVIYRCEEAVDGNTKLCERELNEDETSEIKTRVVSGNTIEYVEYKGKRVDRALDGKFYICTIETRGEGGICIVAPTDGYTAGQNSLANLPVLPKEVRDVLVNCASDLTTISRPVVTRNADVTLYDSTRTDDFDVASYLREDDTSRKLLLRYGWTYVCEYQSNFEKWRRPGKDHGVSASLDKTTGRFYIWTSNAAISPLQANITYTPLQLLATLEYNGDEREAALDVIKNATSRDEQIYELPFKFSACSSETTANVVEEIDSGYSNVYEIPFPESCLNPGGYLQRVMDYTDSISKREQRRLAFGAAITSFGHVLSRRIAYGKQLETSPALYLVGISPPSSGKGAGLDANRAIFNVKDGATMTNPLEIVSKYESVNAFYDNLEATGKQYMLTDEFGAWLTTVQQERSTGFRTRLLDAWLEVFSAYRNTDFRLPVSIRKIKEGGENKVCRPAFSLYGVTNFAEFVTAFNGRLLKNGFIARMSFVVGSNSSKLTFNSYEEENADQDDGFVVPADIQAEYVSWLKFNTPSKFEFKPFRVKTNRKAWNLFTDYANQVSNDEYLHADELREQTIKTIKGRAGEKVIKYALTFAASKYGANEDKLVIDEQCIEQAIAFDSYQLELFKWLEVNEMAENEEDKVTKTLLRYIRSCNRPELTLTDICRVIQNKKQLRDLAISNLTSQGVLELETIKTNGRPKKIFTIHKENI